MRTLNRILAPTIAAVLAIGTVSPAAAADWRHERTPVRSASIRAEINDLRGDINRAAARRMISPREATGLRRDVAGIQRLYAAFARNGLDRHETRTLERKVDKVRMSLRIERFDHDGRRH